MEKKQLDDNKIQRGFINVFFIENHLISNQVELTITSEILRAENLTILEKNIHKNGDKQFIYSIYRFKLDLSRINEINDKSKYQIIVRGNEKFQAKITIDLTKNIEYDRFIFDLKFEPYISFFRREQPPESNSFGLPQQFDIFISFLRKTLKKNKMI